MYIHVHVHDVRIYKYRKKVQENVDKKRKKLHVHVCICTSTSVEFCKHKMSLINNILKTVTDISVHTVYMYIYTCKAPRGLHIRMYIHTV